MLKPRHERKGAVHVYIIMLLGTKHKRNAFYVNTKSRKMLYFVLTIIWHLLACDIIFFIGGVFYWILTIMQFSRTQSNFHSVLTLTNILFFTFVSVCYILLILSLEKKFLKSNVYCFEDYTLPTKQQTNGTNWMINARSN